MTGQPRRIDRLSQFGRRRRGVIVGATTVVGGLLAVIASCTPIDLLNATIPTGSLTVTHDIAYGRENRQRLDIYVSNAPRSNTPGANRPVIVFFYGGAWQEGSKANYLFAAQALAGTGAIVVVPDYRVYPQVTFPGFLDDGAAAIAWTIRNVARWGGNPNQVFLAGHSAGAYISIMLALDRHYLADAGVPDAHLAGAIGISGPYDFLPITRPDIKPIFEVVPDLAVTQPIHYARMDTPPLLLLTGEADTTVGPYNTRNLAGRVRALGGPVETHYYPGVAHIGSVLALTAFFRDRAPVLADIAHFIARHRDPAQPGLPTPVIYGPSRSN